MNAGSFFWAVAATASALTACGGGGGDNPGSDAGIGPDKGASPECVTASQCDDGDQCTIDECLGSKCVYTPLDCDDGNLCTDDTCANGQCAHDYKPLCCITEVDCDDGDPCTTDTCYSYACKHEVPDTTCCKDASHCDDGDPCTLDDCQSNKCTHQIITGYCCQNDLDCIDSNPCTSDTCEEGKCVHVNAGCCQYDEDCDDDDPCTQNGVCNDKNVCEYTEPPGCCSNDAECDDGNACTVDACKDLHCEHSSVGACCASDADCAVTDPCKVGKCVIPSAGDKGECEITLVSSPECCTTSVLSATFDDLKMDGFTATPLYGEGPGWVVDQKRSVSPPASLYFGDPDNHSYNVDVQTPVGGRAASAQLDLSKTLDPELRFQVWKETEIVASSDVLSVIVVTDDGDESVVWSTAQYPQFANTSGAFVPVNISLAAFAGQKVRVVFEFDTTNGFANTYEGVYIDDVLVVGKCQ